MSNRLKQLVYESAMKQGCEWNVIPDVWDQLKELEVPMTEKQLDNDVLWAIRKVGDE